ncbi:unnamed protein product [Prorocentrum cordatum]|uniref:Metallo-beta-lactamase domain-containing protein n=1 Tax=Prorocentrum cordatum TaxID=2364126 RepID=A0ABN9PNF5_9DINO|nr:unnamed protein product [Polarella glacialis]
MRREECQAIDQIVITHWHHDHLTGLKEVLAGLGPVPVRMYLPTEGTARNGRNIYGELGGTFDPNEYLQDFDVEVVGLEDGEVLRCEGATLQVMHTPGHTNDHVCLALEEDRASALHRRQRARLGHRHLPGLAAVHALASEDARRTRRTALSSPRARGWRRRG